MTPDRSHSDTVICVANKVRVEGDEAPFNPYLYVPKYFSSDALPAPEILLIISFLKITESIISAQAWQKKARNCHIKSADGLIFLLKRNKSSLRYLFCCLENVLDFFPLNVLRFVLAYRNLLQILLKEFLEKKSY